MLLTTSNIAQVVNATDTESRFFDWVDRQANVDGETFTITNGNRAQIGNVSYTLRSDGVIRGRCPVIGAFIAADLS